MLREERGVAESLPQWGTALTLPLRGTPAGTVSTVPHCGTLPPQTAMYLLFRPQQDILPVNRQHEDNFPASQRPALRWPLAGGLLKVV